jgi:hypothetical protein
MNQAAGRQPFRFMVDSDYSVELPVWFLDGPYEIEPEDLPIATDLTQALREWSESYPSPVWERNTASWPGDDWWAAWIEQGRRLAQRLLSELGVGYEVVYFNEATEEEEVVRSATG